VVREGSGTVESNAISPAQAHEFAVKAAEMDATKRALMTFGNGFGLSLYGGAVDARGRLAGGSVTALPERTITNTPQTSRRPQSETTEPSLPNLEVVASEGEPAPATVSPASLTVLVPIALPHPDWPHFNPLDEAERLNSDRQERVNKSALALSERRRIRDSGHLAFVVSKSCLSCGRRRAHAHHLKFARPTALGRKASDDFTVPLCSTQRLEFHTHGDERVWWATQRINASKVAEETWLTNSARPLMQGRSTEARKLRELPSGPYPN
jgi:hypothetical protein